MAERTSVTRVTLAIEKGAPTVSMGSYALALYVLGKIDELEKLIDCTNDPLGLDLMDERQAVRKGAIVYLVLPLQFRK